MRQLLAIALLLLLFSTPAGPSLSAELHSADGSLFFDLDWTADGSESGAQFGYSVSAAGDVNGDGYADVIVGAPKQGDSAVREGIAFVFYGSPAGPGGPTPPWEVHGEQQGSRFGCSVSAAGDVNNDGYDDVIVGAYRYNKTVEEPESGAAYLYLGSPAGLSSSPAWKVEGPHKNAHFGYSVSAAGDLNNDNYDDLIVGARQYSNGEVNEGAVFVFHGSASVPNLAPNWSFESDQASALLGSAVGAAGDVNGDNYGDVIVGLPQYDGEQTDEGAALLFFGSGSGLSAAPDWTAQGNQDGAKFGSSVAGAGDVNGDNYDDIVVGAPEFDTSEEDQGSVFLYHGSAAGPAETANWVAGFGPAGSWFGHSVDTAGDLDQDGYADLVVGAPKCEDDKQLEGCVFVFRGGPGGLAPGGPAWQTWGDKAEAGLGFAVGTAGDVNQDGLDDIIVGAPEYRHSQDILGRAFFFASSGNSAPSFSIYLPLVTDAVD